jgi:cbb3-type cytochrome oxidase subunit 3
MKDTVTTLLFVDKEHYGMYEVLSTISIMLLVLAIVLYIFTKKHQREQVRAPLEDDEVCKSSSESESQK